MAIIECTECGHKLSEKASQCPNCGCPIEEIQAARAEKAMKEIEERERAERERIQAEKEAAAKAQRQAEEARRAKKEMAKQKRKEARQGEKKNTPGRIICIIAIVAVVLAALGYGGYRLYLNLNQQKPTEVELYKQQLSADHIILAERLDESIQKIVYTELHPGTSDFEPIVHIYDMHTKQTTDIAIEATAGTPAPEYISYYKLLGTRLCLIATQDDPDAYIWRDQVYYVDLADNSLNFVDYGQKAGFDQKNQVVVAKEMYTKDTNGKISAYPQFYRATFNINAKPAVLKHRIQIEKEHNQVIIEVYNRHYICPSWVSGMWYRQITDKKGQRVGELSFKFENKAYSMYADDELIYQGKFRYKDNLISINDLQMDFQIDSAKQAIVDNRRNEYTREKMGPVSHRAAKAEQISKFTCEDDVYSYLAKHTFVSTDGSHEVKISPESLLIDGSTYPDVPEVVKVDSTMALIRLNDNYHLLIDLVHSRLWDEDRNFYYSK